MMPEARSTRSTSGRTVEPWGRVRGLLIVVHPGDVKRATIMRTALFAAKVRGRGKWFRKTLLWTIRVIDLRAPLLAFIHNTGILELLDESFFPPFEFNYK